jgi:hypothetical protein
MIGVQLVEECPQDIGLSRSHLSRKGDEARSVGDAVKKMGEGFLVGLAQEDETRVGGQIKWFFPEAVKVQAHQRIPREKFTALRFP